MKRKVKANYDRPTTVISKDTHLENSRLVSKTSVQVNGTYIGDIEIEASLVVGQAGLVTGNVKAAYVLVAGEIKGNIDVSEQAHLTKTAKIIGDIRCKSVVIDEGAQVEGKFSMSGDPKVKPTDKVLGKEKKSE